MKLFKECRQYMTIEKKLRKSYNLVAILPVLFLLLMFASINLLLVIKTREGNLPLQLSVQNPLFPLLSLTMTLCFIITLVMVINLLTTRKTIQLVKEPILKLDEATKHIIAGNLDFEVSYERKDEFLEVFKSFETMRQQLNASLAKQQELERNRVQFLTSISHDLKTPLTVIRGYVEGVQDGIAQTEEQKRHYFDKIYQQTVSMDLLIDRIFQLSKMEMAEYPFVFQTLLAHELFDELLLEVQEMYASDELVIQTENDVPSNVLVYVDKLELLRVFRNVVQNAKMYANKKPCVVNISVAFCSKEEHLVVTFSDNGPGVVSEQLPQIFDCFFRGDQQRGTNNKGNGIGLYSSKLIIDAHQGQIRAYNHNGLAIEVKLPIEVKDDKDTHY